MYVKKQRNRKEEKKNNGRKKFVVAFLPMYSLHDVLQNNSGQPISKE